MHFAKFSLRGRTAVRTLRRMSFVTHLECANCGRGHEPEKPHNLCDACQRPLLVRYDLDEMRKHFGKKELMGRPPTIWRYLEMLPVTNPANIVSLTETITPILSAPKLADRFGLKTLLIKDESRLPTGSFKARGMAMAITMARELGIRKVAAPSAGNAGGAMAAYAARAGMEAWCFMPEDTPSINLLEAALAGAKTYKVNGLIDDCGRIVAEGEKEMGWFNLSTLKEPYRLEGKKTMGLELAEQFDWELPDVILYPTGGGTGLIGMWKAFAELEALGWLKSKRRPRLYSCQSDGCAPITNAFNSGGRFAKRVNNAHTIASGLRVPSAVGDFMILDAIRESGGAALNTPEAEIAGLMRDAVSSEGISFCPESAVCLGVLRQLVERGDVSAKERVLIFNTGAAQKYPEAMQTEIPTLDCNGPIPWARLRA
jgi:threonine synthase